MMAAAKNPLAQRVKAHKKQAQGMLTPGLSAAVRTLPTRGLPAIFTHFSVGKAKEASTQMRILDHRRMGNVQTQTGKEFAQAIPQKFEQVQKLLHINPAVSREETIWNEMEKTLPSQGGARSYEEPVQPGEMRAGSVIEKFSVFPKAGQSIDSFKKQAATLPKPAATRRATTPKPGLDPKTRLFSSVQEVTSSQQPVQTEIPQRPPQQPATVKKEPAQPKADTAPARPIERPPAATEPDNEAILKDLIAAMDGKKAEPAAEEKKPLEQPLAKKAISQRKPLAKPATSTPKADAPVLESKEPAQPKAQAKAVPSAPSTQKAAAPSAEKPTQPVAKRTAPATVQRKLDTPVAKPTAKATAAKQEAKPAAKSLAKPVEKPAITQAPPSQAKPPADILSAQPTRKPEPPAAPVQAASQQPVKEAPALSPKAESPVEEKTAHSAPPAKAEVVEAPQPPAPSEMPLHRKIQARREAPKAIKALRPETVRPAEIKPIITPPSQPMIAREKYQRSETTASVPAQEAPLQQPPRSSVITPSDKTTASPTLPAGFDELSNAFAAQQKTTPTPPAPMRDGRPALSMALAKLPRMAPPPVPQMMDENAQLPPELLQAQKRPAPSQAEKQDSLPESEPMLPMPGSRRLTSPISATSTKVVQRLPDDATSDTGASEQEPELNLDQLAEELLPYVKRILQVEAERTPGRLR
jgi:hypothetical protein